MRDWKKMLQYALWPILSLAFYFALNAEQSVLSRDGQKPFNFVSLRAIGDRESPAMTRAGQSQDMADRLEVSDSLLIDSIITIVQNYYVDEPRVENRQLMESTLRSLHENDVAVLSSTNDRSLRLTKGNDSIGFRFSGRYTYDDLMRDAMRTSQFLERQRPRDKSRKTPSGSFQFLSAMLASLDPHSNLLTPDEYRDLRQGTEGSFGGLGVVVGIQDDVLTVIKPLPKSPAARAGVSKFDRIMQIDGKSTFGTTLDDLVQYMRGEPGTKVNLFVLREGDFAPRRLSLTREVIQVDSVESKLLTTDKGKILYSYIDSFSSRTAIELRDAMIKAQRDADPLAGVILDMRGNPGGLLDQAVKVADLFIDEGRILSTQGRTREYEMAKNNLYRFDYPLVILTNGDTASASEIVAGALRDHGRALVIGEPSFGKGSVQTVFELPGEQALKLTIARYFTPKGISIQNTGIMPDIWLQPVHKAKENWNLLGEYRYKSERYLDHSLDPGRARVANQNEEWKAFYLLPEENPASSKVPPKDIPLDFAQKLLTELAQRDGVPMPRERLRSSYWKASASQFLRESLERLDGSTEQWLQARSNVDWSETPRERMAFDPRRVKFTIDLDDRFEIQEGQPALIPWRVKNLSKEAITRLSVFVSSNRANLGTSEVLIGKVEAGEELRGVIRYEIKSSAKDGPVRIRVGLARSGGPLARQERPLIVEIKEGEVPRFDIAMKLTQEAGGKTEGVLEAGEQARLEVTIRNNSQVTASMVEAKVANLAGKQIRLDERKLKVGPVEPGETRVIRVPIQASLELTSEQLQVGVSVVSREQMEASKSHFFISGSPAPRVSKSNVNTGRSPWTEN
jgi:carboxyl-terminal processing protease